MRVHKAQAVTGQVIPDLLIEATEPIPENNVGWAGHAVQAVELATVLRASLPGGTLDLLTAELLIASASRLIVRHPDLED